MQSTTCEPVFVLRDGPASLEADAREQRRAALNLMEDAILSREATERLNAQLRENERRFREMIDALPVAIYTTDAEGRLTHFNPAAVEFSGRTPELGSDLWCVSWKLYWADGTPMPHDKCPMAIALKEGRIVSGLEAIAERPDGKRVWFTPYPTPLREPDGRIVGGINMLLDITERKRAEHANASLAAIVESSDDAIISKDLKGVIASWNKGAEHLFGYTAEEAIGRSITMLIPPDRQQEEPEILARLARGESVNHFETVRLRKDGSLVEISLTISPLRDSAGRVIGASKIARDITERKRAEESRRENERRLRFILDSMPQKIFTARANGDVDYLNPVWTEFTGLSFDEIKDWGWTQFIHPDDVDENVRAWKRSIASGERFEFEHRFRSAAGEYRWHLSRAAALKDGDGRVVMWIGSNTDIQQQMHAAAELRELADKLSDADRRKNEFLAMLAHELRNPLAPIANAVQWMALETGTAASSSVAEQARGIIERQAAQLTRIVDDLLDVSRITSGRVELRRQRVNLNDVAAQAAEAVRPLIEAHRHKFAVSLAPGAVWLDADPARLEQVVVNLLNNAAKYTDEGGRVSLSVRREGGEAALSVRDTGIGIAAELLPRVFDLFTQAERSLARSQGGLGIGLTLVRRLVEMHGGQVEAHSEPGAGSEFVIRLPVAPDGQASVEAADAVAPAANPTASLRVLVVDDNVDAAHTVAALLTALGHDARTAHDGEAALAAALEFQPDMMLLDIGLPGMDGLELAQRIRQQPTLTGTALIAMTGYGQESDRRRSHEAGFDQHLVKPVDVATLRRTLATIIKR